MRKIGMRVGAVASMEEDVAEIFGYGIYEGDFKIDNPDICSFGIRMASLDVINPRILLDNGSTVWGCECWWGAEEGVKKKLEGKTVKIITVEEYRKRSNEEAI